MPTETTIVPPINPMLVQHMMVLLKGLSVHRVLPYGQSTQALVNFLVPNTMPNVGGNIGTDIFFRRPLLGSVIIGNGYDMLTNFSKS